MKPHIYLLTHSFPYSNTETFLESEAPILAQTFDLTFVPAVVKGRSRPIPENARIDTSLGARFAKSKRKLVSLFSARCWSALLADIRKHKLNIHAMRRINSFVADALATRDWCLNRLKNQPGLVYTYWLTGKTHGLIWAKQRNPKLKIVSRAHRFDLYDDWYDPAFWPLRQQTINQIDHLFVISDHGLKFLNGNYQTNDHVTVSRLGAIDPKIQSKRSTDGILRIVSCSSLLPQKRVRLIAELISTFAVSRTGQKIHWHHFGDGPLRQEVLNWLESNKPTNLTYTFPGSVANQQIMNYYRKHPVDVFVNLSDSEGIPVSIMEAQACGITVMATEVGGVAEIVNDSNGILVDKDIQSKEFNQIMSRVANNENIPDSKSIIQFFHDNFNAQTNYEFFSRQLAELMDGQG